MNVAEGVAACEACGGVFSLAGLRPPVPVVIPAAFSDPARDEGAQATYRDAVGGATHRWTHRWFRWQALLLVPFTILWTGAMVGIARQMGPVAISLPHVWVAVVLPYVTLACLFNRTTVTLDAAALRVRSGPIPWPSTVRLRTDIVGFDAHRTQRNAPVAQVRAVDAARRAKRVMGLMTEEEAKYLSSELSRALASDRALVRTGARPTVDAPFRTG